MPWSEHQQLPACLETCLFRTVFVLRHCVETFVSLATTWLAQAIIGILSQPVAILCWTTYTTLMYPFSAFEGFGRQGFPETPAKTVLNGRNHYPGRHTVWRTAWDVHAMFSHVTFFLSPVPQSQLFSDWICLGVSNGAGLRLVHRYRFLFHRFKPESCWAGRNVSFHDMLPKIWKADFFSWKIFFCPPFARWLFACLKRCCCRCHAMSVTWTTKPITKHVRQDM